MQRSSLLMDDELARLLLQIGRAAAGSRGGRLSDEEARDCATAFAAHMLEGILPDPLTDAFLARCAHHFTSNYLRVRSLRRRHEVVFSASGSGDDVEGEEAADSGTAPSGGSDSLIIADEFWVRVLSAAQRLRPVPQAVFLRRFVREETIGEIALSLGKSEQAVSDILLRATRRLRVFLEEDGVDEEELRLYLAILLPRRP